MNRALAAAFGLLLLGVCLGAALRLGHVTPVDLNVSNATHAHSHTLYWGGAGLALFTLFFERVGATGRGARWVLGALAAQGQGWAAARLLITSNHRAPLLKEAT